MILYRVQRDRNDPLRCSVFRDNRILHRQQSEFRVRAVRSAGRATGARLHRAVLLELGADGHVLPVQAAGQGLRRRARAPRDHRRAGQMFPDAQGQDKLNRPTTADPREARGRGSAYSRIARAKTFRYKSVIYIHSYRSFFPIFFFFLKSLFYKYFSFFLSPRSEYTL